jgi:TetR/AcrR family fatty acid metabolism transcriptional regulator
VRVVVVAEPRHRAVDGGVGHVVGADAEMLGDTGAKSLEKYVGTCAQGSRQEGIGFQIADDRLRSRSKGGVPGGCCLPHGVALGRFDAHDPGAEPRQLPARIGTGEVAGEVHDENVTQRLHGAGAYLYPRRELTDRSIAQEGKRKLILDAAIRVFAERGYHGARVGDIAEQAGVAHGLLYHYFSSKEEVLQTVFRENWVELLGRFRAVEESDEPAGEKLQGIAKILLRTWRNDPALVTVMVREVARSPQLQGQVEEVREAFGILERVIREGQERGELRADVDPQLASWILYGGLEEVLTGWVLGGLRDRDQDVELAERTAVSLALRGLTV